MMLIFRKEKFEDGQIMVFPSIIVDKSEDSKSRKTTIILTWLRRMFGMTIVKPKEL